MMIGPLMKKAKGVWTIGNMSSLTISIAIELKFGNSALWRGRFGGGRDMVAAAAPCHLLDSNSATLAERRGIEGRRWDFCWGRKVDFRLVKGETQTSMDWEGDVTGGVRRLQRVFKYMG